QDRGGADHEQLVGKHGTLLVGHAPVRPRALSGRGAQRRLRRRSSRPGRRGRRSRLTILASARAPIYLGIRGMATTVHIPRGLLDRIDARTKALNVSRNLWSTG